MKFHAIPDWAIPSTPAAGEILGTVTLAGLVGKWIRLDAATQRAVMGAVLFGKKEFMVNADGTVSVCHPCAFGLDADVYVYTPARLVEMAKA